MSLANAVQGATRPSQLITWLQDDGSPLDLSDAVITATIYHPDANTERAAAGLIVVTDGPAGQFRWDYDPADVAEAGDHEVQFTAEFSAEPSPAKSYRMPWYIAL